MSHTPDFDEALRKQREAFKDVYETSPALSDLRRQMDEMFAQDEAEPVKDYASRRGE